MAPDGVEWRVGRRWPTRSRKLARPGRSEIAAESLNHIGANAPDFGNVDLGEGLLVAAAVVAFLVILIPVLFFGLELIILGVLLGTAVITHTVLGQPWAIEARSTDPLTPGRQIEWRGEDGASPASSSRRSPQISQPDATPDERGLPL